MVWITEVSSKGQLVLPKAVRDKLGVKPGGKVVFIEREGRIELEAYGGDILRWYGALEVDGPQDWNTLQAESGRCRAGEVARESESPSGR